VARMASLLAGLPQGLGGSTINRLCGSGLDAVGSAARAIRSGEADLVIAGGVESMSRAPFVIPKADKAFSRAAEIYDTTIGWRFVNRLMKTQYGVDSMPETAENVAREFGIERIAQEKFKPTPLHRHPSGVVHDVHRRRAGGRAHSRASLTGFSGALSGLFGRWQGLKIIRKPTHQPRQVLQIAFAPLRKKYARQSLARRVDGACYYFAFGSDQDLS
jgi:hypothetical protein